MREILFKAQRTDTKEWVEGYICRHPSAIQIGETSPWWIHVPPVDPDDSGGVFNVDPETVGQYTGLIDKNGKKIFDGDIITIKNPEPFSPWICKVIYRDCGFWLEGISRTATVMLTDYADVEIEVTGNINDKEE